jgi:hypothetical protein
MTTIVPLTKGKVAVIDDEDAAAALAHVWRAHRATTARENWYAYATIDGHKIYLHRYLMKAARGEDVDHDDGDGLNNRRVNLKTCCRSQNNANSIRVPGLTGFIGVYFDAKRNRYRAGIWVHRKRIWVGWFAKAEEAAQARDVAQAAAYGTFARLNFPPGSSL